jgi:hypothetical protein
MRVMRSIAAFLALAAGLAFAGDAEIEAQRRNAELALATSQLDRIAIATAQSKLMADAKFQEKLDYFLYRVRPPALWNASNPAWVPARAALIATARPETLRQLKEYLPQLHPILAREIESTFQPGELVAFLEFTNTAGAKAYFDRRLADLRAKNGEALYDLEPEASADLARHAQEAKKKYDALAAIEKKRVEEFLAGAKCAQCYRPPAKVMDSYITGESDWLREVFTNKFESTDYSVVDRWVEAINTRLKNALPLDSKKQILGALQMRKDSSLAFTFNFYWHDKSDGGALTLEFPPGDPRYRDVAALAPGLAPGKPRVLYRDKAGVISDQP